ncbi:cation:proton antiporter [Limibacter armeniacum]|uniref:cation:proton antiporter n=1 Tax=Limibacter armeniacum TaxID=466084 RepID=UPI002FE67BCA
MLLTAFAQEVNVLLAISTAVMLMGLLLKKLKQPYILAYILSGVLLGPYGLQFVTDYEMTAKIGDIGLVILMFFIGMEISLPDFLKKWKIAFFGTGMQVIFSLLTVAVIGFLLGWSMGRIILLGFIISISSSAVVIKLVENSEGNLKAISESVISILLTQDILIVPMMIILTLLGGESLDRDEIIRQVIGGGLVIGLLVYILRKKIIRLPFEKLLEKDHELQVFAALLMCFGFALLTSLLGLSASLGALASGMLVNATSSSRWLHDSLHSFRIILVSIFFLSIGMLIDLNFLVENWKVVAGLVLLVYLSNHGINTLSLKFLGNSWKESIYGGSLLAQIGEFSFVLASLGYNHHIISSYSYQLTIVIIAITIFLSPAWVLVTKKLVQI